mmetsp:Transcript_120733/g.225660  ORF Transcript_120733/g.225660 Transcript_120733/m.225660 type:complete len:317 (-) Transcript_120733:293-1243(-)
MPSSNHAWASCLSKQHQRPHRLGACEGGAAATFRAAIMQQLPQPRMCQNCCRPQAVSRLTLQQRGHEILSGGGDSVRPLLGKCWLCLQDPPVRLLTCRGSKWWLAHQQLIAENTQSPDVNTETVAMRCVHHLRRKIIQGATQRPALLVRVRVHSPPKVSKLRLPSVTYQHILWLHVSVDHVHAVTIFYRTCDLCNKSCCTSLLESLAWLLLQHLAQISIPRALNNHEDMRCIPKESEELQNIGMSQVSLDLDLMRHMPLHTKPLDAPLFHRLENDYCSRSSLPCQQHTPECARTNALPKLEIVQLPHSPIAGAPPA